MGFKSFLLVSFFLSFIGNLSKATLPEPSALGPWQNEISADIDFASYPSLSLDDLDKQCPGLKFLYPSQPQQSLKKYSLMQWAPYDLLKISAESPLCLRKSNPPTPNAKTFCLRTDSAHRVILSDTYMDSCGNYYRGFHSLEFLGQNETMGTLFSLGRAAYPDPSTDLKGIYIDGSTYPVPIESFSKIGPLLPSDLEQILSLRSQALSHDFTWSAQDFIFIRK
jgi:hypothetical protein